MRGIPLWVLACFAALELLYFLPMLWGWHSVPFHMLNPRFTGVEYRRDLPPDLRAIPGHDPSGVIIDYPCEFYAAERMGRGELPWWNPRVGMGRPWLGNGPVQAFSPLLAPFWVHPNPWTFSLQWVLGSIACLLGAYWLLLLLNIPHPLALLGAGLWTWNPFTSQMLFSAMMGACWWWPLALAGALYAIKHQAFAGWLISACAFALMGLCGHVETAVYLAEMAGFFILCIWWGHRREVRPAWVLAGFATCITLAVALTAAQWIPLWEVARDAASYKSHGVLGDNKLPGLTAVLSDWESDFFLLPVLAGSALLLAKRRIDWRSVALGAMVLFCLFLDMQRVADFLPFRLARLGGLMPPVHAAELAALPLAGLAALGLSTLISDKGAKPSLAGRWIALSLCAALTTWAILGRALAGGEWLVAAWLVAMTAVFALCLFPPPRVKRDFALLGLGLLALLYPLARGRFLYPSFSGSPQPQWTFLDNAQSRRNELLQGRFWAPVSENTGAPLLTPDLGLLSGLSDVRSSLIFNTPGSEAFSQAWGPGGYISLIIYTFRDATPELLSFLGVDRVALPDPRHPDRFVARAVAPGPRAFFVKEVLACQDDKRCVEAFRRLLSEGSLHRQAVVLAGPETRLPLFPPGDAVGGRACTVAWEKNAPEHQVLRVDTPSAGLLVVLDAANHLWRARVDGKAAPLLRTDVMFRGVFLTAGDHRVEMTYDTRAMRYSIAVAAAAWILVLAWLAMLFLRRRKSAPDTKERP